MKEGSQDGRIVSAHCLAQSLLCANGSAEMGINMKDEKFLEVQDLSWTPEREKQILKEISIVFQKGGFYGILGPNGSGKTSLLKHLIGFVEKQSGAILIEDKAIGELSRKELSRKLALVPQNTGENTAFSAYDMIAMGRNPYRKFLSSLTAEDKAAIDEAIRLSGCEKLLDKSFLSLSGGEAQRVVTARAIAQNTPWILLDEPVSHLDVRYQVELMKTLAYLNEARGTTVIAILHDLNLAASYCRELVLMKHGRIVRSGAAGAVLTKDNLKDVYEIEFSVIENPETGKKYYIPL